MARAVLCRAPIGLRRIAAIDRGSIPLGRRRIALVLRRRARRFPAILFVGAVRLPILKCGRVSETAPRIRIEATAASDVRGFCFIVRQMAREAAARATRQHERGPAEDPPADPTIDATSRASRLVRSRVGVIVVRPRRPAGRPDDHDGFGHRSTTLSLALCARGLTATSWAVAVTGFLVRTVSLGLDLNAHLTRRSSSEWKLMIAALPPGASSSGIASSVASSWPSSSLTAIRSAWKTRVAGSIGPCRARPGTLRRTSSASWPVVRIGVPLTVFDDPAGDPPAEPFLPQFKEQLGQIGLSHLIDQVGRARAGLTQGRTACRAVRRSRS